MKIIGITGGIGSGKSVVSRVFEVMNIPVYIADIEAKKLMENSPVIREKLTEAFGNNIYNDNTLDKNKLASLIFNNPNHLQAVNSIVHPLVFSDFSEWIDRHSFTDMAAIESAILFESGFDKKTTITVNVFAPIELRIKRIRKRDSISRKAALERISNQLLEKERNKRSDYRIVNDNKHSLIKQTEILVNLWKQ